MMSFSASEVGFEQQLKVSLRSVLQKCFDTLMNAPSTMTTYLAICLNRIASEIDLMQVG